MDCTVERDPDGGFTASFSPRPGVIAAGEGGTVSAALADLAAAVALLEEHVSWE